MKQDLNEVHKYFINCIKEKNEKDFPGLTEEVMRNLQEIHMWRVRFLENINKKVNKYDKATFCWCSSKDMLEFSPEKLLNMIIKKERYYVPLNSPINRGF